MLEEEGGEEEEEEPYLGPSLVYTAGLVADASGPEREGGGRLLSVAEHQVRSKYYSRFSELPKQRR